jgi:hypothetical protein
VEKSAQVKRLSGQKLPNSGKSNARVVENPVDNVDK